LYIWKYNAYAEVRRIKKSYYLKPSLEGLLIA